MSYDLFLSHSQQDKDRIEALCRTLARSDNKLYTDYWEDRDTLPHSDRLREQLRDSDAVLVYWGPSVEERDPTKIWVGWEIGVATEQISDGTPIIVLEDMESTTSLPIPELTDYAALNPTDSDDLRELPDIIEDCIELERYEHRIGTSMFITSYEESRLPSAQSFHCINCEQEYRIWLRATDQKVICPSCNRPGDEKDADRVV